MAEPPPSYIPWEMLRDALLARFGPVFEIKERYDFEDEDEPVPGAPPTPDDLGDLGDLEVTYHVLLLGAPEVAPRLAYATFGAGPRIGGHEVFIDSTMPFWPFKALLDDKGLTGLGLSPGQIIDVSVYGTPFTAILLAPEGGGSIAFACPDGVERHLLRAVPLTAAERELSRRSPGELLRALGEAGALEKSDPFRDCVVEPQRTRAFWVSGKKKLWAEIMTPLPETLRHYRRQVAAGARHAFIHSTRHRLILGCAALRCVDPREAQQALRDFPTAERMNRHEQLIDNVVGEGTRNLPPLRDERWQEALDEVIGVTLLTHPVAQRFIAMAGGVAGSFNFEPEGLIEEVRAWLERLHPYEDLPDVAAAGRAAASEVLPRRPTDRFSPSEAWKTVVITMYFEWLGPERSRKAPPGSLISAIWRGISAGADSLLVADSDSAAAQLTKAVNMIALIFLTVRYRVTAERGPSEGPAGSLLN